TPSTHEIYTLSLHDALPISREQDGLHIRDIDEGDAMIEIAKRAIIPGQPKYYRRIAEYAALEKEEELVAMAGDGDIIIQASPPQDRKSTRLNSSHLVISYAV